VGKVLLPLFSLGPFVLPEVVAVVLVVMSLLSDDTPSPEPANPPVIVDSSEPTTRPTEEEAAHGPLPRVLIG
jgi:hypothetical protein